MGQKKFHQKHLKSSRSLIKVLSIYGSSISLPHVSGIRPSLTWLYQFAFRVKLISGNDQEASKNVAHVKSGQNWDKKSFCYFYQGSG